MRLTPFVWIIKRDFHFTSIHMYITREQEGERKETLRPVFSLRESTELFLSIVPLSSNSQFQLLHMIILT